MQQIDLETQILDVINNDLCIDYEKSYSEYGDLIIKIKSPCKEIGTLIIRVNENEITFSCAITHTHFDKNYFNWYGKENPAGCMLAEAIKSLRDFIKEKSCVFIEVGHDGREVCTGWGSVDSYDKDRNEDYLKLIEKLHGGPSTYKAFTWNNNIKFR